MKRGIVKKILSFVCAAAMLSAVPACPSFAAGEPYVLLKETFNAEQTGTAPSTETGVSVLGSYNQNEKTEIADFPSAENKSIVSGGLIQQKLESPIEGGGFIISYDFYIPQAKSGILLMNIYDKELSQRALKLYTDGDILKLNNNAWFKYRYPVNEWFTVTVVGGIEEQSLDIYINGQKHTDSTASSVGSIGFMQNALSVQTIRSEFGLVNCRVDNMFVKAGFADKAAAVSDANALFARSIRFSESFDEGYVNAREILALNGDGTYTEQAKTALVSTDLSETDKWLKFNKENYTVNNQLAYKLTEGTLLVSYDFYFTEMNKALLMEASDEIKGGAVGARLTLAQAGSAWYLSASGNTLGDAAILPESKNNIALLIDLDSGGYYVYLNGNAVGNGGCFGWYNNGNPTGIKRITTSSTAAGNMYVNNMYLESFSSKAAAEAVLSYREKAKDSLFGASKYGKQYLGALAGCVEDYRFIGCTDEEKAAAENKLKTGFGDFSDVCSFIFTDDYDSYADGYVISSGKNGYTYAANSPAVSGGVLKIENSSGGKANAQRVQIINSSAPKAYTVSFDFTRTADGVISQISAVGNSEKNKMAIEIGTKEGGKMFVRGKNFDVRKGYIEQTLVQTELNKKYNVSYYVNMDTQLAYVYIDGDLKATVRFYYDFNEETDDIEKVFDSFSENISSYSIDNLTVYEDKLLNSVAAIEIKEKMVADYPLPIPSDSSFSYEWSAEGAQIENGVLKMPSSPETIELTLRASKGIYRAERNFSIIPLADSEEITNHLQTLADALTVGRDEIYSSVIRLPLCDEDGITTTWSSSAEDVISVEKAEDVDFAELRVKPVSEDTQVTLTASLTYDGSDAAPGVYSKTVTVKSAGKSIVSDVLYKDADGNETYGITSGGSVDRVFVTKTDVSADLYSAAYSTDGTLLAARKTNDISNGFNSVDMQLPDGTAKIRNFVWGGGMNPLSEAAPGKKDGEINFFMLGDSMMATYVNTQRCGWGSIFGEYFDDNVNVVNDHAHPGYSIKSLINEWCLNDVLSEIESGDYVFISSAHNDSKPSSPATYLDSEENGAYSEYLEKLAEAVRARGGHAIFVTSIERCIYSDSAGTIPSWTLKPYSDRMKNTAAAIGVPVVDANTFTYEFLKEKGYAAAKEYYMIPVDGDATHLRRAGAELVCEYIRNCLGTMNIFEQSGAGISYSYNETSGKLTIAGTGAIPAYTDFAETPWNKLTVREIELGGGIASVGRNSLSGFTSAKKITFGENISEIAEGALSESDFTVNGYYNTAAETYAAAAGKRFTLAGLRILSIGNSHTWDYTRWIDKLQSDLSSGGLNTKLRHSYIVYGGRQLFRNDTDRLSHLTVGSDSAASGYSDYDVYLRDGNVWDLIILQDYHESSRSDSAQTFPQGLSSAIDWVKSRQPQAKIAWVADWAEKASFGSISGADSLDGVYANITAAMTAVENSGLTTPDFIIPMGTVMQNARSSYLGSVNNASDAYMNFDDTDWAWNKDKTNPVSYLGDYTVLERDSTHCSHELGRYIAGAGVYKGITDYFADALDKDESFDFCTSLKTAPVTLGNGAWKGEFTDSIWKIVRESVDNAYKSKKSVTRSQFTKDPADDIAAAIASADYSSVDFADSAAIAAAAAASAGGKITVSSGDVSVSDGKAYITFLYGYTKKTAVAEK